MNVYTLLEYAAMHGYLDIVRELIKARAVDLGEHTALSLASSAGHVDVVRAYKSRCQC